MNAQNPFLALGPDATDEDMMTAARNLTMEQVDAMVPAMPMEAKLAAVSKYHALAADRAELLATIPDEFKGTAVEDALRSITPTMMVQVVAQDMRDLAINSAGLPESFGDEVARNVCLYLAGVLLLAAQDNDMQVPGAL